MPKLIRAAQTEKIPVTAVIASAIEDAEGFPITRMPISPYELWELRRRHADGEIPSLHRTSDPTDPTRPLSKEPTA